jgi:ankyrin repeat protein
MLHRDLAVKIEHGVRTLIERQDDQERESILSWLSPLSPSARQSEVFNSHQRGTGTWLFGTAEFQRWIAGDEKSLFCPGIPGAGKTVLASIIIDHLERTFADREDVGITYFFCDYRQQQTLVGLYSALLKQLVQGQVSIPDRVVSMWKTHSNKGTSPSEEEVYSQLRSVITKCRRGLIVLDALDECPVHNGMQSVRTIFLRKIMRLCEEDGIGILATSRPDQEISAFFKIGPFVEIQASTDDIESYVEARIDELHSFAHEKPGLKQCIKDDITRAASGMYVYSILSSRFKLTCHRFLLARLYFNLLMDQSSEKRIQGMLQKFRTGSQSTAYQYAYNETVKRIESQSSEKLELAKATIGWIMSAKRPFTVEELEFAIAIEAGSSCPDKRNITSIKQLISVCCGLVVVDETTDHVNLVHYTTQKYFESIEDTWLSQMNIHLTKSCLTYISYEAFEAQPWHLGGGFALLDIPLYEYMFRNWGLHYKEHPTDQTLALQFLENEAKTAHSPYHDFHPHKSEVLMASCAGTIRGEHVAAFFGLADLLEDLLNIGTDYIEDRAYNSYTPLFFAALNGHEAVAQLLLDRGAKIEVSIQDSIQHYSFCGAPTDSYASPLFEAAAQGHDVIVRLFLDAGAEINGGDETLDTPLIRAIFGGHESTIRLLLEEGANTEQKLGRSSLHAAIDVQNEGIVKLLLSRGADTEFTGADDMSALQLASIYTNEAILRLLLDAGAKVDVADKYGNTLLHEAVLATDMNVIRLLLDKGASTQIKNWRGRSSLHAAVTAPSATVVKLLLDRGAEVNSATKYGDTPLHIAALYGH